MGGAGHALIAQTQTLTVALLLLQHAEHARQPGQCRRFQLDAFTRLHLCELAVQGGIADGVVAVDQALQRAPDKARGPPHRQTVGGSLVVDAEVIHRQTVVQAGVHPQQHAR
ncbi:hypothetical protein D3C72_2198810 [compost metagenome]